MAFDLDHALRYLIAAEGSDLHLKIPAYPLVRLHGGLGPIPGTERLFPEDTQQALAQMLDDADKLEEFDSENEVDFTYSVEDTRITSPAAVRVLRRRKGKERLALTACHPLYSNAKRIVVIARLWSGPGLKAPVEETGSQGPAENIDPCLRYDCPE